MNGFSIAPEHAYSPTTSIFRKNAISPNDIGRHQYFLLENPSFAGCIPVIVNA
jgi:hypothetical protein